MLRISIFLLILGFSSSSGANDKWVNNSWKDDFTTGLWKGCIDKAYVALGYFAERGNISGIELRDSQDPELLELKRACNCQTKYFEEYYTTEELKHILGLGEASEEYVTLILEVYVQCK